MKGLQRRRVQDERHTCIIENGDLDGPVTVNAIPRWHTHHAVVNITDHDGRASVVSVADNGNFSAIYQTIATVPSQRYLITLDVWADLLHNVAGNAYCTSTDSNGLLDIHDGTELVA